MKLFRKDAADAGDTHDYDLSEVQEIAVQGRRLAIYDRETGLYAYWYRQLRGTEEISRSQRHGRGVFCVSIWAPTPASIETMRERLKTGLRDHDLAAYLNNGHFVARLTETHGVGAAIVLPRLIADAGVTGGVASFPADGHTVRGATRTRQGTEHGTSDGRGRCVGSTPAHQVFRCAELAEVSISVGCQSAAKNKLRCSRRNAAGWLAQLRGSPTTAAGTSTQNRTGFDRSPSSPSSARTTTHQQRITVAVID